tara:strand:- start:400 stop:669 length:270 start_codon:yes stop_codon:yes gene_type:complete
LGRQDRIISTFDEIYNKLKEHFPGADVTLENTSSQHVGHNSHGMHLKTTIIYDGFEGKSTIDQHKMVHLALKKEIGKEIHAITISTSCS